MALFRIYSFLIPFYTLVLCHALRNYPDNEESFKSLYERKPELIDSCAYNVYEGIRKSDGQKVAIKIVAKKDAVFSNLYLKCVCLRKEPFIRKYVLQMYEWFEMPDRYILIFERLDTWQTLCEFISCSGGRLCETVARELLLHVAEAADRCLQRGIVHKNICPRHVLVDRDTMQIKLMDFDRGKLLRNSLSVLWPENRFENFEYEMSSTVRSLIEMLNVMVNRGCMNTIHHDLSSECQDLIHRSRSMDPSLSTIDQLLCSDWFRREVLTFENI